MYWFSLHSAYYTSFLNIVIATTFAVTIVGRAITIWEAIENRTHEPIYKTDTKNEAKRLRATLFVIAKL